MNKLEQAARQALDMMEFAAKYPGVKSNSANLTEVSQALREALAQPQGEWVDLTDDEIKTAYESWWETNGNHAFPIWVGAKSVIAAFKEKNK